MDGGDYKSNSKLLALRREMERDPEGQHVIYIDSKAQRNALSQMFLDMGMSRNQVKNIASTATGSITGRDMSARVKAFKEDPRIKVMMIDKVSSSGFNLQNANTLHVLGTPQDAATYLQAQGRVARSPRVGDVNIRTYRYNDNPVEQSHWNNLDAQLKVLQAASPGLFVE